jgi:hypothetical protein
MCTFFGFLSMMSSIIQKIRRGKPLGARVSNRWSSFLHFSFQNRTCLLKAIVMKDSKKITGLWGVLSLCKDGMVVCEILNPMSYSKRYSQSTAHLQCLNHPSPSKILLGFRRIRRGEMTRSSYWKSSKSHLPTHRRWLPTRDHSCTQLDCRGRYRWGRPQARCNSRLDRCM